MSKISFALRVHQLESLIIDNECKQILMDLLKRSFLLSMPLKLNDFDLEIKLLIEFLQLIIFYIFCPLRYYRFTIAKNIAFPGQTLQNILFVSQGGNELTKRSKLLYFLMMVVGKWLWLRAMKYLDQRYEGKGVYRKMKLVEMMYMVASFMHFILFLRESVKINSLSLWLCGVVCIQKDPGVTRELDFDLVNRTLIWSAISRVLSGAIQSVVGSGLIRSMGQLFMMTSFLGNVSIEQQNQGCSLCKSSVRNMPVRLTPCNHEFCYYCFKIGDQIKCPQCKELITNIEDVIK